MKGKSLWANFSTMRRAQAVEVGTTSESGTTESTASDVGIGDWQTLLNALQQYDEQQMREYAQRIQMSPYSRAQRSIQDQFWNGFHATASEWNTSSKPEFGGMIGQNNSTSHSTTNEESSDVCSPVTLTLTGQLKPNTTIEETKTTPSKSTKPLSDETIWW